MACGTSTFGQTKFDMSVLLRFWQIAVMCHWLFRWCQPNNQCQSNCIFCLKDSSGESTDNTQWPSQRQGWEHVATAVLAVGRASVCNQYEKKRRIPWWRCMQCLLCRHGMLAGFCILQYFSRCKFSILLECEWLQSDVTSKPKPLTAPVWKHQVQPGGTRSGAV